MAIPIAFLGTGLMGQPMAARLLARGHPLTVWNRTRAKTAALEAKGAKVAESPGAALAEAEVAVAILENGRVVEEVLFGSGAAGRLRTGALVIDMSSIPPPTARDHAVRLAAAGVGHLDAPVSGGPYGAEAGTLAIMVGGRTEDVARAAPILEIFGRATHVGRSGSGQLAKLVSQGIVAAAIGALSEGLLLAAQGGADPAKVREALIGGFADSKILHIHGQRMLERDFVPGGHARTHLKDLDALLAAAAEAKLELPLARLMHALFADLCRRPGGGDLDHSALLTEIEARNAPARLGAAPDRRP